MRAAGRAAGGGCARAVARRRAGARAGRGDVGVLAVKEGPDHFTPLAELCVSGDVATHIDRTFPLDEVPAALAHVGEGRALGKVVVTTE